MSTSSQKKQPSNPATPKNGSDLGDQASFEELMRDLAAGSEEAAWLVAERYSPHILRAVRACLPSAIRSKVDSVDLMNSLWGALLVKRGYLASTREPGQLIALLTKAARNRVIEEYRKYTVCQARDIKSEAGSYEEGDARVARGADRPNAAARRTGGETPSEVAMVREKWRGIVKQLDSRDRLILQHRVAGLTYQEIASKVPEASVSTVRRVVEKAISGMLE